MRDYSKTIPDKTVINGTSGALETTWVDPAPNFFRFNLDGAQWGSGLGAYVVNKKGWNRVAAVSADYSFGYTNFLGFAVDVFTRSQDPTIREVVPLGPGARVVHVPAGPARPIPRAAVAGHLSEFAAGVEAFRIRERVPRDVADLWVRMCPAQVYEVGEADGDELVKVEVTPSNCVQCGAITAKGGRLTPPEGGSGPEYTLT